MPEAEFLAGVKSLRAGPGSPLGGQEIDVPGRQALEPKNGNDNREPAQKFDRTKNSKAGSAVHRTCSSAGLSRAASTASIVSWAGSPNNFASDPERKINEHWIGSKINKHWIERNRQSSIELRTK